MPGERERERERVEQYPSLENAINSLQLDLQTSIGLDCFC